MIVERRRPSTVWHFLIEPGQRVVSIDGYPVNGDPLVIEAVEPDALLIETTGCTERRIYRGSVEAVTVLVDEPYAINERERKALLRNRHYVPLLRTLADGPRLATSRGEGVIMASMSDVYGYCWTERGPRIDGVQSWQLTERGTELLALMPEEK